MYGSLKSGTNLDVSSLRSALDAFYDQVDAANTEGTGKACEYYRASLQASNDRSSRILRGERIREVIEDFASSS